MEITCDLKLYRALFKIIIYKFLVCGGVVSCGNIPVSDNYWMDVAYPFFREIKILYFPVLIFLNTHSGANNTPPSPQGHRGAVVAQ